VKFLSICSGIESASVAWEPLGYECIGVSEIEPFRSAVLQYHYPEVKNYGDFTKIEKKDIGGQSPDVLVGGTPCATFSVAGLREGIKSDRGNLALEFIRLIKRLNPTWVLWENVPGVLSSNEGKDLASFLGGLAELGYGFAYRVLDTQYIRTQRFPRAIPQMRRRIFVVGHSRNWRNPAKVLFNGEALSWDTPPRREKREEDTRTITHRLTRSDQYTQDDIAGTIAARDYKSATDLVAIASGHSKSNGSGLNQNGAMYTITANDHHSVLVRNPNNSPCVVFEPRSPDGGAPRVKKEEVSPTLTAMTGGNRQPCVARNTIVRRLTPLECERLQGLPDNYTQIPYRGKPKEEAPVSKRYEACGRAMSINVMEWLGTRIKQVQDNDV